MWEIVGAYFIIVAIVAGISILTVIIIYLVGIYSTPIEHISSKDIEKRQRQANVKNILTTMNNLVEKNNKASKNNQKSKTSM